jgi:hypothetical protein
MKKEVVIESLYKVASLITRILYYIEVILLL